MGFGLEGSVVLVSGGAGEIGSAVVRGFAAEGCRVVIGDIDGQGARSLAEELGTADCAFCELDVTNEDSIREAVRFTVKTFGRLDVLVNVAGILNRQPMFEVSREAFRQSLEINVLGAFFMSREAASVMRGQGGGRIVNISSLNGTAAIENRSVYGATKAALDMITRSMALELGAEGITVNAVAPGVVDSRMARVRLSDPEIRAAFEHAIPLGRLVTPEDVRDSVLFLASPRAGCVTGEVLLVDGGVTARQALPKL